jgi:prohibitin 1
MGNRTVYLAIGLALMFSSCAIIRPGEAGVKTTLGKVDETVLMQGPKAYFPFTTRIIKLPLKILKSR